MLMWCQTNLGRWRLQPQILIMLMKLHMISLVQIVRNNRLNVHSVPTSDQIILTIPTILHILSPHIASDFVILISNF